MSKSVAAAEPDGKNAQRSLSKPASRLLARIKKATPTRHWHYCMSAAEIVPTAELLQANFISAEDGAEWISLRPRA